MGEMIETFERHRNGGGLVGVEAEVTKDTFVGPEARVIECAEVYGGRLEGKTRIDFLARCYQANIVDSRVGAKSVIVGPDVRIRNCALELSSVSQSASLDFVHAFQALPNNATDLAIGGARVFGNARAAGGLRRPLRLYGDVTIFGDAHVHGDFVLSGPYRIHTGEWTRPPLLKVLPFDTFTECVDGKVNIGCRCFRIETFLRKGAELAREHFKWTDEMVEQAREVVLEFQEKMSRESSL
jgi:hypothetical protein